MTSLPSRSRSAAVARGAAVSLVVLIVTACHSNGPPTPGPEARCASACHERASQCGETQCARGCRFVLDRLVEHEGRRIVACVAKAHACDDATFAECAAVSGPYLDGGPPPPGPKKEVDLDEDDGS